MSIGFSAAPVLAMPEGSPGTLLFALGVSFLATGLLIPAARRMGWIDRAAPGEEARKTRRAPVTLVGGTALALAGLCAGWPAAAFPGGTGAHLTAGIVAAAAFLLGHADDLLHHRIAGVRIAGAPLAALVVPGRLLFHGLLGLGAGAALGHPVLADPVAALLWAAAGMIVGVVVNTWDHADGLAGGLGLLALAGPVPALAAACLGFLPWNFSWRPRVFKPGSKASLSSAGAAAGFARVPAAYLGNAGSSLLGAWILLEPAAWPALALPLADLLRVVCRRVGRGRRPWRGDRSHLAHRLLACGYLPVSVAGLCLSAILPSVLVPALRPGSSAFLLGGVVTSLLGYGFLLAISRGASGPGRGGGEGGR